MRDIALELGGVANGFVWQGGFDITVASEVMAILCLASDLTDLQTRLGRIVVGYTRDQQPVTASDLKADGAMMVLLKDALQPNLVHTLENNPALVHGGPFANIAHGCNSVMATRTALQTSDYVVTEAGFGADLGAEKFFEIKCRLAGIEPSAVVLVATIRALKMNGGVTKENLSTENIAAVVEGCADLGRHIENLRGFGLPVVVALNHFSGDATAEISTVQDYGKNLGIQAIVSRHWAQGGAGAEELAHEVVRIVDGKTADFRLLYPDDMPLTEKIQSICARIYRASRTEMSPAVISQLKTGEEKGYGHLPVCIAKTQYSFSTDPRLRGAPTGHVIPVREIRLSADAGFIVAICGDIMTMPGLPRHPAAEMIGLDDVGEVKGLF